jgi:ribosomal protein S12 methylthiotransferase accessory factor
MRKTTISNNDGCPNGVVDARTGIINSILEHSEIPGEPRFFHYTAHLAHLNRILPVKNFPEIAGGASIDRYEAKMRAIGEAIERYAGSLYFDDEIIYNTYNELSDKALNPDFFPTCSDQEYANPKNFLSKPRKDASLGWVSAFSYTKGKEVVIPASYVYLTYMPKVGEELITMPISTGLAAGQNLYDSTLAGLCEVIERDAMMIMWLNQLSVSMIDIDTIDNNDIIERIKRIENVGIRPYLFDMTTDIGIPSVFVILVSETGVRPIITVAAAAHPNPIKACTKALDEGIATRRYCIVRLMKETEKPKFNDLSRIRTLEHHLLLYAYPEMATAFEFLFQSDRTIMLKDMPKIEGTSESILKGILHRLLKLNLEVLICDLTREDIKQSGFSVVKVIIPKMQPLSIDHNIRYLGVQRLYELPRRLGYTDEPTKEESLNPFPHPFA